MSSEVFETDSWAAGLKQRVMNRTTNLRMLEAAAKVARHELLEADRELTEYLVLREGGAA